jgi:hypothetical protein
MIFLGNCTILELLSMVSVVKFFGLAYAVFGLMFSNLIHLRSYFSSFSSVCIGWDWLISESSGYWPCVWLSAIYLSSFGWELVVLKLLS